MAARVALVTGSNQGIGLQIVRELCKKFDGSVLLTARSLQRGEEARRVLESEGLHPSVLHLDVDSQQSIQQARDLVKEKYGRLDVLVNNAGVSFHSDPDKSFYEKAVQTIKTNYHGCVNVTQAFSPLLQPNSRIVNISSGWGKIFHIGPRRQEEVLDPDLTVEKLSSLMDEFVSDAKNLEDFDSKGWVGRVLVEGPISTSYIVSKVGIFRLTELFHQTIGCDPSKPGMLVNSVCPGWVRTNMSSEDAPLSVEEGADTPVYLALLPPGTTEPNGQFVKRRVPQDWKERRTL